MWAFIDKLLGLEFTTKLESAWLNGGSPTTGFLTNAVKGPFAGFFQGLAGQVWIDWLFMIGLLLIGISLILGIFHKLATYFGALLLFLMLLAVLPPEHNLFLDDHIIYGLVLLLLYKVRAGDYLGYGKRWKKSYLVKKYSLFE